MATLFPAAAPSAAAAQARYGARAQLAYHGFERPSIIGAELLLLDKDCFGLLWHGQVQSLSLYVRVTSF